MIPVQLLAVLDLQRVGLNPVETVDVGTKSHWALRKQQGGVCGVCVCVRVCELDTLVSSVRL